MMNFTENKPIYKQIIGYFYSQILNREWLVQERVPSVREVAVLMEVNPNTALRAFQELQEKEILYNKRGVGYFVTEDAFKKVKDIKRRELIENKLPALIKDMQQLGLTFSDLEALYHAQEKDS